MENTKNVKIMLEDVILELTAVVVFGEEFVKRVEQCVHQFQEVEEFSNDPRIMTLLKRLEEVQNKLK